MSDTRIPEERLAEIRDTLARGQEARDKYGITGRTLADELYDAYNTEHEARLRAERMLAAFTDAMTLAVGWPRILNEHDDVAEWRVSVTDRYPAGFAFAHDKEADHGE